MPIKDHCECDEEGVLNTGMESWYDSVTELPFVKHAPGKCKCTNELALYERKGKTLTLCSNCHCSTDKRL